MLRQKVVQLNEALAAWVLEVEALALACELWVGQSVDAGGKQDLSASSDESFGEWVLVDRASLRASMEI